MKKRGFGKGKYNGVGGKIDLGEDLFDSALRETKEEIGVIVKREDLIHVSTIKFIFPKTQVEFEHLVEVFVVNKWQGLPIETDEVAPKWFNQNNLPLADMWDDDKYWLPKILKGQRKNFIFYYNENEKVEDFSQEDR